MGARRRPWGGWGAAVAADALARAALALVAGLLVVPSGCGPQHPSARPAGADADAAFGGAGDAPLAAADQDADGDGYTPRGGDCNDAEPLVNPGAYEVPANGIDDNCNGLVDEVPPPCEAGSGEGQRLAGALELCPPFLVLAEVTAGSNARARAVLPRFGAVSRRAGASLVALSTGVAADEAGAGFVPPQPGTDFATDGPNPLPTGNEANACGRSFPNDEQTIHDPVELRLTLRVPTNARGLSFDLFFLTSEYPEWIGREYNDKFLALLDSRAFRGNVSRDGAGRPITVNVGFFSLCQTALICSGTRQNRCAPAGLTALAGTGYELDDGSGAPIGGGTGWLTTTTPVTPGETATLRLVLFDEGDHLFDSTVLLDHFAWQLEAAMAPATVPIQ